MPKTQSLGPKCHCLDIGKSNLVNSQHPVGAGASGGAIYPCLLLLLPAALMKKKAHKTKLFKHASIYSSLYEQGACKITQLMLKYSIATIANALHSM